MIPPKGKPTKKTAKGRGRGCKPRGLGECILILPYIRRLGPILGGSNFEFQYLFIFFQKDEFFLLFFLFIYFFFFWGGGEGWRGMGGGG